MTFVVIPYRFGGVEQRLWNMLEVVKHIRATGLRHFVSSCDEPWSPGKARNEGVRRWADEATTLVFNDADTICPHEQIRDAVRLARDADGLVYAYDLYVRRNENGLSGETIFQAPSMGCVAMSRHTFDTVGGFDEGYVGWGYEDVDFAQRCGGLWPIRRVGGPVYHLWHGDRNSDDSPADSDPIQVERNLKRWRSSRTASTV